ncbi:hypothetical protein O6H91_01G152700 [Diphasiastrum complanatum]|uniref:Uncharacterized protein n=1 Tax=Diphasiastrum complanatum TaxID=34168 RepID=A0ACC2EXB3_DIPCM|nr:hypothetical protein O6H91_01G152700 [Diphasiastrum complanatum]
MQNLLSFIFFGSKLFLCLQIGFWISGQTMAELQLSTQHLKMVAVICLCLLAFSSDFYGLKRAEAIRGTELSSNKCPCEEIYVVREGETLHSISARCKAPFILLDNSQIQDGDDLSEGLALLLRCVQ